MSFIKLNRAHFWRFIMKGSNSVSLNAVLDYFSALPFYTDQYFPPAHWQDYTKVFLVMTCPRYDKENTRNAKKLHLRRGWDIFLPLSCIDFARKTPDYFREITQEGNSMLIFILLQANPVKTVSDYKICPELECSAFGLQIRALFSTHSSFLRTRNNHRTAFVLSSTPLVKWWNGDFQWLLAYLY